MRRFLLVFALLLVVPGAGAAVGQGMVREAVPPDGETLHRWLESGDPRLVAWAAFHAEHVPQGSPETDSLRTHLQHLAQVYQPLSTWDEGVTYARLTQAQVDGSRAMLMVLNTLMQWHAALPPDEVLRMYPEFGSVPMVLLRNYCHGDSAGCDAALLTFLQRPARLSDQIAAADMLAEKPPAGYALALLRRVSFDVDLTVSLDGKSPGLGEGSSSGDCGNTSTRPDWPEIKQFYLSLRRAREDDVPFLPSPIPVFLGKGMCQPSVPESLYSEARVGTIESGLKLRLAGAALGLRESEMPVAQRTGVQICWTDAEHFRTDVDAAYLRVRTGVGDLLEALIHKGLLQRDEAAGLLRADRPELLTIRFLVFDARPDGGQANPLPSVRFHDPHVEWNGWPSSTSIVSAY